MEYLEFMLEAIKTTSDDRIIEATLFALKASTIGELLFFVVVVGGFFGLAYKFLNGLISSMQGR